MKFFTVNTKESVDNKVVYLTSAITKLTQEFDSSTKVKYTRIFLSDGDVIDVSEPITKIVDDLSMENDYFTLTSHENGFEFYAR